MIKQSIPFPSVTICMEGSTLWPTVQAVLEQHQVSAQELPKVSAGFIRLKLNETEYEARKEFIDRGRKKLSDFCKDDFRIFKFLFFITTMMDKKIEKGTLYNDTVALADELDQETYSEDESESYYETKNNVRHEAFYYRYLKANESEINKTYQQQNLVKSYLYFNLLKLIKVKVMNSSIDIFEGYFHLMREEFYDDELSCPKETISLSDSFEWIFSYDRIQAFRNKSLTWNDVSNNDDLVVNSCYLEREWNIDNNGRPCFLPETEESRELWLSRCKKNQKSTLNEDYQTELFVFYRALEFLEVFPFPDNSIQLLIGKTICL